MNNKTNQTHRTSLMMMSMAALFAFLAGCGDFSSRPCRSAADCESGDACIARYNGVTFSEGICIEQLDECHQPCAVDEVCIRDPFYGKTCQLTFEDRNLERYCLDSSQCESGLCVGPGGSSEAPVIGRCAEPSETCQDCGPEEHCVQLEENSTDLYCAQEVAGYSESAE